MPKNYGVKEKDQVVTHIINLVMTGKLRSGDRIDRNEIVRDLGLSRVPIQEAVVQLEHDGILSTRYHRGAFVSRFDEATVPNTTSSTASSTASPRPAVPPTPPRASSPTSMTRCG
ncbi:HTH-type transcriptional regulator [Mycolicibacterium conceptionense]|uniref:HTH-type transcriptional regulator n=1 Tax=Mycolicibacterium conceptionense TaxID=451644 RepID=A0A0U1CW68_9MYCO|nr:HTH-type transcriptional regulator [Mycolicibacterium conceptionense]